MTFPFHWLALGLGLLLCVVLVRFGGLEPMAANSLPLLTLLIMAEFGFFLTAAGSIAAGRSIKQQASRLTTVLVLTGNLLLAGGFMWLGLRLWPYASAA